MSRRERRDDDSRRHRSRFDQEPSPKRSRRDGKPETERPPANVDLDNRDNLDRDQKHHRRLQDSLPLQAPIAQVSKEEAGALRKEYDKANVNHEGIKQSLDPAEVPRSRSYFQHDKRGDSGQVNRSSNSKASTGKEQGWWRNPRDQLSERANRMSIDMQKKDERSGIQGDDRNAWRHDRYHDIEADPKPRKRPSFRERKISDDSEKADKVIEESLKANANKQLVFENEKRENRDNNPRHLDRTERSVTGDIEANNAGTWRGSFSPRDRHSSRRGNYRGRERFTARQGNRPTGGRVEKWKHDLFDEANRSPSPKKDEDMVAKVEALLAS